MAVQNGDLRNSRPTERTAVSLQEMFEASLLAFWALAVQIRLSVREQAMLLAIHESTCRRWHRKTPSVNVNTLDRLQLVLLTYASVSALAAVSEDEKGSLFRARGSAESPDDASLSLLEALSARSLSEMSAHCLRIASRCHAV